MSPPPRIPNSICTNNTNNMHLCYPYTPSKIVQKYQVEFFCNYKKHTNFQKKYPNVQNFTILVKARQVLDRIFFISFVAIFLVWLGIRIKTTFKILTYAGGIFATVVTRVKGNVSRIAKKNSVRPISHTETGFVEIKSYNLL